MFESERQFGDKIRFLVSEGRKQKNERWVQSCKSTEIDKRCLKINFWGFPKTYFPI